MIHSEDNKNFLPPKKMAQKMLHTKLVFNIMNVIKFRICWGIDKYVDSCMPVDYMQIQTTRYKYMDGWSPGQWTDTPSSTLRCPSGHVFTISYRSQPVVSCFHIFLICAAFYSILHLNIGANILLCTLLYDCFVNMSIYWRWKTWSVTLLAGLSEADINWYLIFTQPPIVYFTAKVHCMSSVFGPSV